MYVYSKGNEDLWRENLIKIRQSDDLKSYHFPATRFQQI